jgi:hypothetical protein
VAGKDIKVCVVMEQRSVVPNRNSRDQAVDQPTYGLAPLATLPIQIDRNDEVLRLAMEHRCSTQQAAKLSKVQVVSCAGKDLHNDGITRRDLTV